ncbi:uncharacterized protein LOC117169721 [Belonocnema kinseyi]|uniref:uncharacterized protein LOC117169721 n=1 Tax=Belonocnema kinseyi TaxID=2817044 RepID=UPI00143D0022|nr:uncharacterized protein LOC117169721 [Belonocnema kinseyi]
MFKESGLKIWEVIIIILGISTRFNLSYKGRRALIEATKLFAGPEFSSWDISDYYLSKIFDPPEDVIKYHFYCEVCCQELEKPMVKKKFKKHKITCQKCLKKNSLSMRSPNYFLSIDIKYQIASLLKMQTVKDSLFSNLQKSKPCMDGVIRDVHDGLLYRNLSADVSDDCILLTCIFNTDGAPVNETSKDSFWPKLVIINELPANVRFRHPLLAGLWIGKKEPSAEMMNTYIKSFVEQLNDFGTTGFTLTIDEKPVRFLIRPLVCTVDSVARPVLQNRVQFNAYYGCSWCKSVGGHKLDSCDS